VVFNYKENHMTNEEAFKQGCNAMQAKIAATLMVKGNILLAPMVLGIPAPEFKPVEVVNLSGG
jgi:hypothetical protein